MFDELKKYETNHFFFNPGDELIDTCNAPANRDGVYLVYALSKGRIELVYIGSSGAMENTTNIQTPKPGRGGIKDTLVNGEHFNGVPRRTCWPLQMRLEKIEAL